MVYSKTCLKQPLEKKTQIGFQDQLSLNAGQKYCRILFWSILQYFQPSLSYHLSLRPLFCLFLSSRLSWFYRLRLTISFEQFSHVSFLASNLSLIVLSTDRFVIMLIQLGSKDCWQEPSR